MGTLRTPERTTVVRQLIQMIDNGKTDDVLKAFLYREYPYAMSTMYGLIKEAHERNAALESRKGPVVGLFAC